MDTTIAMIIAKAEASWIVIWDFADVCAGHATIFRAASSQPVSVFPLHIARRFYIRKPQMSSSGKRERNVTARDANDGDQDESFFRRRVLFILLSSVSAGDEVF